MPLPAAPLLEQLWFQVILGALIVALLVVAFRLRLRGEREQNARLESQVQERTAELENANALLEKEVEQRKRAEAELEQRASDELKQSEARFQAIYENAAVGIAILTLNRRSMTFNPVTQRIIGYTEEEMKSIDPLSLALPEDRDIDRDLFRELTDGKRNSYMMERRYVHKSGRVFWARINYSLVRDLEGEPDYLIGIIDDIDDERRAAERITEAETEYRRTLEQRVAERTAELQEQIQQRKKAEQELSQVAAQEAVTIERTRLARDLHDAVTQTLFSASLIAEVLPADLGDGPCAGTPPAGGGAPADARRAGRDAHPAGGTAPQRAGGRSRCPTCCASCAIRSSGARACPFSFETQGGSRKLPPDVQISLYRIAQEALNNIVKHAKATQAVVTLHLEESVRLSIEDNGCGFDPAQVPPDHLGIRIMRERAEMIGADLSVYSEPGEGTQISLTWKEEN